MYVSLEYRGKALGCQMLLKAKSILLSHPESELTLTVFSKNYPAIRVYEKFGFEQTEKNGNELAMIFKGGQVEIS